MGSKIECCCSTRQNDSTSMHRQLSVQSLQKLEEHQDTDLDNVQDLKRIFDKNEKFKYIFPFYRMDIDIFELKLRTMGGIKS